MNSKSIVALAILGLSCGALGMQACSSSSSGGGGGDDGGSDSGADQTSSGAASSSGSSSGTSSGGSSSGSSGGSSSGSSSGGTDGGMDATTCTPFDAGTIDPTVADAGMQLVLQFKCYGCHQSNALDAGGLLLSGRLTSLSDSGPIYPPNLTPDPGTGLGCWTPQQVETALLDGIDNQDASLCVMPKFRARFTDAGLDIDASANEIAAFLRTLPAVKNQVPDTTCPSGSPSDAGEGGTTSDAGDGGTTSDAGSNGDAGDAGDGATE